MKKWVILLLALLLASCSLFGKKAQKKEEDDKPKLVGRVASLPSGGGYALIEAYGPWQVPTGGLLSSAGEGRTATLTASGEKLGRFAAADIKSGALETGDAVFYRPVKEVEDDSSPKDESKPKEREGAENSKKESLEPLKP